MSRFWSKVVEGLDPYVPGEQPTIPDLIKLNTNESPYGPSPSVLEAVRAQASDTLRLYPDPESIALRDALATYHGVRRANVFVGNGSDEVLGHIFAALLKHDAPLLLSDITYGFYPVYCRLFGICYETVPVDERLCIRVSDYRRNAGGLVIANPNAQTGIALKQTDIVRLLDDHPDSPVVIDEAYVDFGGETAAKLIGNYPNLVVVRTFSKSRALAGLRLGYALADAALIEALIRVKNSFNSYPIGRVTQAAALACIADDGYFWETRDRIVDQREKLAKSLTQLGFDLIPSSANFVLARRPGYPGPQLATELRKRAILVRTFPETRISDYVRITIGTDHEMNQLVATLSELVSDAPRPG
ncbi:histidinol-phosphate transaminase [Methylobacterium sp. WL64]|uniref:histidinol-phosphate transaminase n=1 Tax=Methylobacterium sp. WL64 TaxID=2603894 RepID=UPI0011CC4550|nr:histidinol-phosphate transaminase [Methylobacterium sp. WL64]TXM98908.1 histidinol-phosphate transaminase [Methylobacterium sp. WL64]